MQKAVSKKDQIEKAPDKGSVCDTNSFLGNRGKYYKTQEEYLNDLDVVFCKDYGKQFTKKELVEVGRNFEILLANFL